MNGTSIRCMDNDNLGGCIANVDYKRLVGALASRLVQSPPYRSQSESGLLGSGMVLAGCRAHPALPAWRTETMGFCRRLPDSYRGGWSGNDTFRGGTRLRQPEKAIRGGGGESGTARPSGAPGSISTDSTQNPRCSPGSLSRLPKSGLAGAQNQRMDSRNSCHLLWSAPPIAGSARACFSSTGFDQ